MKRLAILIGIVGFTLSSCVKAPVAEFFVSPTPAYVGEQVTFDNLSSYAQAYEWNFGDGNSSTAIDPTHVYTSAGNYTVTLTAFGKKGDFSVYTYSISVTEAVADFYITTTLSFSTGDENIQTDMVYTGEYVTFQNTSSAGLDYEWDFGDGYSSDVETPIHYYTSSGTYYATLKVKSGSETLAQATARLEVYAGTGATIRLTVLDYAYDYLPVEDVSVLLYGSLQDWDDEYNPSEERFTSALGKVVFEDLTEGYYYVDAWRSDYNNYALRNEDYRWIETQYLQYNYLNDFFVYVDYTGGTKKLAISRAGARKMATDASEITSVKRSSELKDNKFTKAR